MAKESEDPFDLLGIEPGFELDVAGIQRRVRRRIASRHPDRISDPIEQAEAVREVARLNEAWALVADEERRANAYLARLGGPSASDDRSLPPTFLLEILEIREQMEDALASGDHQEFIFWKLPYIEAVGNAFPFFQRDYIDECPSFGCPAL